MRWPSCDAHADAPELAGAGADPPQPKRRRRGKSIVSPAASPDPLGGLCESVPADVHTRMVALHAEGLLPTTTPEQRSRAKMTTGTDYHTPKSYTEALRFCCVHPDLEPAKGYRWRWGANSYSLVRKGG